MSCTATGADGKAPPYAALVQSGLDALEQGITIFDADLKLVFANNSFLKLRDLPLDLGRIGTSFEEQVRFRAERGDYGPGDVETLVQAHVKLARRFEAHRIERTRADGLVLAIRGDPLPGGGFIAVYSDITDRKRAEEMVLAQNAALEAATDAYEKQGTQLAEALEDLTAAHQQLGVLNRAKNQFLANMSHELRTPLNAIIGFSEIIESEILGPVGSVKYRDYAGDIHESGQHLLALINDILDLSKIESGVGELHEDEIEVPKIIRSAVKLVGHRAEQGGVKLQLETAYA